MRKASGYEKFNLLRSLFLTVAVIFFTASNAAALNKVNGVYQIGSCQDMVDFAEVVNDGSTSANAVVTAPIDMSCSSNFPMIGNASKKYSGSFNGLGYPISNLKIVGSETQQNVGLFGVISAGSVSNIVLANASISATKPGDAASSLTPINVGVVVGLIENNGSIDKAYASGSITTSGNNQDVGGVVGNLTKGSVKNALSTVSIASNGKSAKIGGVVGENKGSVTQSAYDGKSLNNNGNSGYVGGVVGSGNAATKSYSGLTTSVNTLDKVCVLNGGSWSSGKCSVNGTVWNVGENIVNFGVTFSGTTTLVAATFDANGGKFSSGRANLVKGFGISAAISTADVETPTREGYTFAGWALANNATEAAVIFGDATKGTTLYAVWKEQVAITFDVNSEVAKFPGSATTQTKKFDLGSKITSEGILTPADYEVEGTSYKFLGWALTSDAGVPANLGVADVAKVVYAVWKETKSTFYKLTFEMGGHGFVPAQNVEAGTRAVKPEEPSAAGYIFDGWYTSNLYNIPFSFVTEITGNTTVYAKWNAVSYTITYHLDGGVNSKLNPFVYTEEYGTILFEPAVKDGFVFEGWFADEEKTIAKNSIPENELGNVVVYAKWRAATYKISYLAGGDGVVGNVAAGEKAHGADYTLSSDVFTRAGYTQSGWSTVAGGNKVYELGATYAENKELTLFPYWGDAGKYALTYDTTSAAGVKANYLTLMVEAKVPHYLIDAPEKDGYKFGGWKVTKGGVTVSNGKFSMPSTAVVISGKYELINYTVSYETNGAAPIASATYNVENAVTLPVGVSKTGFTFEGWYDNPYFNGEPVTEIVKGDFGDKTFYAKWQELPKFNVEYFIFDKIGNLRLYRVDKVAAGDKYTLVNSPDANAGYSFDQWKRVNGENFVPVEASFIMPEGDVKLAGRFIANKYVLTWNFDGGVATGTAGEDYTSDENPVVYRSLLKAPAVTKTGYVFVGWNPSVHELMPAQNITYTALWTPATVAYQVKYNYQNVSGSEYTLDEEKTVNAHGLTESVITYENACGDGFTLNSAKSETKRIAADGSTVVNVYCDCNVYEAVFKAEDVVLYTAQVRFGATPEYIGSTPTKAATAEKSFVFEGWEPAVVAITGNAVYSALFEEQAVSHVLAITYKVPEGAEAPVSVEKLLKVGDSYDVASPVLEGYTAKDENVTGTMGSEDVAVVVEYTVNKFSVTYKIVGENFANDAFKVVENVAYGTSLNLIDDDMTQEGYFFSGWSGLPVKMPNQNVVVTGSYTVEEPAEYRVVFLNGTTTLQDGMVAVGVTPVYNGETPIKAATDKYTYTFLDWNPEIVAVTGNAVYEARFDSTAKKYAVSLTNATANIDADAEGKYAYGTVLTLTPSIAAPYHFTQWSDGSTVNPRVVTVTGDASYEALSAIDSHVLTITYKTPDGVTAPAAVAKSYNVGEEYSIASPSIVGYTADPSAVSGTMDNENVDVTVNYTANSYTITLNTNGGESLENVVAEYGTAVSVPDASRPGYTFAGWVPAASATMPAENITLTASWTVNQATITFNTNGGNVIQPIVKDCDAAISAPVAPTKKGYVFAGWYSDETLENPFVFNRMPAEDVTVYAKWVGSERTISLNLNGGTLVDGDENPVNAITGPYGNAVPALGSPTKTGYSFAGWYADTRFTKAYSFTIIPMEDIIVYAKWNVDDFTIKFNSNGGSAVADVKQPFNSILKVPTAPTKTGYEFVGWYSDEALNNAYSFATMPAENITVYAKWEIKQYEIAFETNGGTSVEKIVQDYNSAVVKPAEDPSKTGYTFAGWYADSDLKTVYVFNKMPAENITVYAKWKVNQYTITFVSDGSAVSPITQDFGSAIEAPKAPTKVGHTFKDWEPTLPETMPAEDISVTATWTVNVYTITYELNGGNGVASSEHPYGSVVEPPTTPTKTGFVFDGWYAEKALVNKYTFGNMPAKPFKLYAKWAPHETTEYKIARYFQNVNDDGYTLDEDKAQVSEGPTGSMTILEPAGFKGYEGFSLNETKSKAVAIAADGSTTVNVYYDRNEYTVTFKSEGVNFQVASFRYGAEPKFVSDRVPEKKADLTSIYNFVGWEPHLPPKMPAENITVNAVFEDGTKVKYQLVWDFDGGVAEGVAGVNYSAGQVTNGARITYPTKVSMEGHTLTSWIPAGVEYMPTKNLTLKAVWTANNYTITLKGATVERNGVTQKPESCDENGCKYIFAYGTQLSLRAQIPEANDEHFVSWKDGTEAKPIYDNPRKVVVKGDATYETVYGTIYETETDKNFHKLTITYVAPEGVTIPMENVYQYVKNGESYSVVSPKIEGYTADKPVVSDTMGNQDVSVTVTYNVNKHKIVYKVTGEYFTDKVYTFEREYGKVLRDDSQLAEMTNDKMVEEGHTFGGWESLLPYKMPDEDIEIPGSYTRNSYKLQIVYVLKDGPLRGQYTTSGSYEGRIIIDTVDVLFGDSYSHSVNETFTDKNNVEYTIGVSGNKTVDYTVDRMVVAAEHMPAHDVREVVNFTANKSDILAYYEYGSDGSKNKSYKVEGIPNVYKGNDAIAKVDSALKRLYYYPPKPTDESLYLDSILVFDKWSINEDRSVFTPTFKYIKRVEKTVQVSYVNANGDTITVDVQIFEGISADQISQMITDAIKKLDPTNAPKSYSDTYYWHEFIGWKKSGDENVPDYTHHVRELTVKVVYDEDANPEKTANVTIRRVDLNHDSALVASHARDPQEVISNFMKVNGYAPEKKSDDQYHYSFVVGTNLYSRPDSINGSWISRPDWTETLRKYPITFKNGKTVLKTIDVDYGTVPVYDGTLPVKESTTEYSYEFDGWDPDLESVSGPFEYVAKFKPVLRKYKLNYAGAVADPESADSTYDYGTEVKLTAAPEEFYHFTRWSDGVTQKERSVTVDENAVRYEAISNPDKFILTIVYTTPNEGRKESHEVMAYGETRTYVTQVIDGYSPVPASFDLTMPGKDTTVSVTYTANNYSITLKNASASFGEGVEKEPKSCDEQTSTCVYEFAYGTKLTLTPADSANHTFTKWKDGVADSPRLVTVTGNAEYEPEYSINFHKLTITYTTTTGAEPPKKYEMALDYGTKYSVTSPELEGHTPDKSVIEGTLTADAEYAVVYSPKNYPLTIHYKKAKNGVTVAEDHVSEVAYLKNFSVESPEVENYTSDSAIVNGVMNSSVGLEITVTYTGKPYKVIAKYIPKYGSEKPEEQPLVVTYDDDHSEIEHAINDVLESNDPVIVPQKTYTLTEKFTFNKTWTKGDDGKYTPNFKVDPRDKITVVAVVNERDYSVDIPNDDKVTADEVTEALNNYFADRTITPLKASTLVTDYTFNETWTLGADGKYTPNFNENDRPQTTVTAVVNGSDYPGISVPGDSKTTDAEVFAAINNYFAGRVTPLKPSTLVTDFAFNETWTKGDDDKYTPNFNESPRKQKNVIVIVNKADRTVQVPANGSATEIDEAISIAVVDRDGITPRQDSSLTQKYTFVDRSNPSIRHWKEFDDDIYIPLFDSTARAQVKVVAVVTSDVNPDKEYEIDVPADPDANGVEINAAINHYLSEGHKAKPKKKSTLTIDYAFTDTWAKDGVSGGLDRYVPIFNSSARPQTIVKVDSAGTIHNDVNVPTDGTVDEIYDAIKTRFVAPKKSSDRDSTYKFECWTPDGDVTCASKETLPGKITSKTTPFVAIFLGTVKETTVKVAYEKNDTTYKAADNVLSVTIHVPDLKEPSKVLAKVKAAADSRKPSKVGYTFNEWDAYTYEGENLNTASFNAVHDALPVNGIAATNLVYLAGWNINQYTITFDCKGGNIDGKEVVTIKQDYNSAVTDPKYPSRSGYSFDGWDAVIPEKIPAENITINAKWTKNLTEVVLSADPIYTGAALAPSVTVNSGETVLTPADYDIVWDKEGFVNVGEYNVTVKGKKDRGYTDTVSVTAKYTIKKADPKVTVTMAGWTYGETAKDPSADANFKADDEPTITYAKKGSSDWSADKPVNAGTYVVKASVANTDNYNYAEKTAEFTISQAPIKIALSASEGTYTGLAHVIPTHTVNSTIGEKLDVTSDVNAYDASWNDSSFTNVKTYTITVKGKGNYTGTQTLTYVINPARVTVTAVANTKVYGVKDPTFTATVKGLVNGESENLISYTLPRDVGENAGIYKIKPTGDKDQGNYTVAYVPNDFTITKDVHNTLFVAMEGWVYSGKADKNPVPTFKQPEDGINVKFYAEGEPTYLYKKDGSDVWTDKIPVDAGSYIVKASVKNTNNYSAVEAENTFIIEKFMGNVVTITLNDNWDYDGKTYAPKTSVRFKKSGEPVIQYAVEKDGDEGYVAEHYVDGDWSTTAPVNQGTYVVKATVEDTDNYNGTTATKVYTINRADVAKYATISAMPSVYYDGNKHAPTVTVKRGETALVEGEDKDYTVAWDKDGFTDADTYTVTVTGQGNYTGTKTAKYIIKQAPIQIVLTQKNEYNGGVQVPSVTLKNKEYLASEQDLFTGDGNSVESTNDYEVAWSYKYNGKDSTLAVEDWFKHAGVYTISVTGKDKSASGTGNYSGTTVTASYTIDYAPVTVTAVANTKVYGDDDPTLTATIAGVVENEKEHAAELIKYSVSRAEGENVNKYTITPTGDEIQGNYKVSYETVEFTITPAPVVITAESKVKSYGEADPELTVTNAGMKKGDVFAEKIKYSIVRDKARTSEGEVVGVYTITPSGEASQGNYSVSYVPATLTVNKSEVNTVEVDMEGWTFGEVEKSPTNVTKLTFDTTIVKFHAEGEPTFTYATVQKDGDNYVVGDWNLEKPHTVGTYTIRALVAETPNYIGAVDTAIFEIKAAPIQIVMDPTAVLYNGTEQNPSFYVKSKVDDKTLTEGSDYTISWDKAGKSEFKDVATYTLTVSGKGNYAGVERQTYEIQKNTPELAVTMEDWTYSGKADKSPVVTYSEWVDPAPVITYAKKKSADYVDADWSTDVPDSVGNYVVKAFVAGTDNYNEKTVMDDFAITHAQVVVTAEAKTKVYGQKDPDAFTATVNGMVNDESTSLIKYSVAREPGENVGEYTITPSGGASQGNYSVTYVTDKFTITPAETPVIALSATGSTYNGNVQKPGVTLTFGEGAKPLVAGTDYDVDWGESNWTDVGTYTVKVKGKGNFAGEKSATFEITQKAVSITVADASKIYGNEDPAFTGTVVGLVSASDLGTVSYRRSGEGQNVGTYADSLVVSYTDNANYAITVKNGTFTINRAEVTVAADALTKQYKTADPDTLTTTITGLVSGEARTLIDFTVVRESGEDVGTYAVTLTGAENQGNYHVTYVPADFTITPNQINEVTVAMDGWTYTGSAEKSPVATATFKANDEPAISYARKGSEDWSATVPVNAGTYVVKATVAATANYVGGSATAEFTIAPASFTIALSENKIYTGLAQEPTLSVTSEGAPGIVSTDYDVAWTRSEANATSFVNADAYTVTVTGKGNYTGTHSATYKIAHAEVSVTPNVYSKIYGSPDPTFTAKVEGLVNDESEDLVSYMLKRTAGENVGEYTITATGDEIQGNYQVTYGEPATFRINRKAVIVVADAGQRKVYGEADPTLKATINGVVEGEVATDKISYSITRAEGENVGEYSITPSGDASQGNYSVTYVTDKFTITPAETPVIALSATGSTYNGEEQKPGVTLTFGEGAKPLVAGTDYDIDWGEANWTDADTYTVTVTGKGNFSGEQIAVFTIDRKAVIVTAVAAGKVFGSTDPTFTATVEGLVKDETISYTVSRASGENVGTYAITPSGDSKQGSYSITYNAADFTITTAMIPEIALSAGVTYNGNEQKPNITVSFNGNALVADSDYTIDWGDGAWTNAGSYTVKIIGMGNFSGEKTAEFTIDKKSVVVSVDAKSKTYGSADPELSVSIVGLVNGESAAGLISYEISRVSGENVGTYAITATGASVQGNYNVSYEGANLTIEAAATPIIALSATSATYNGEEQKPGVTVTFNGNALVAGTDYTIDWGEDAWTASGTYTVKVTGQANFSGEQTAEFTIGLAEVTVTAESKGKTYGDVDPVLTAKVEGMVNGESSADLITYTIVRDAGEVVGTYAITLSGTSVQGNYSVSYVPGILSIAKATRNDVTVAMSGWTYGEAAASPAVSADFSAEGEPSIAYAVKKTGDYAESDWSVTRPSTAGTYVVRATVAETSNYVGGSATAEFTIAPAAIQVALSENKTYNGLAQTPTLTVKSGETSLTENVDYTVSWNRTGFVNADSYTVTVSGKNNYTGTETATFIIAKKSVEISVNASSKMYGENDPIFTGVVSGLISENDLGLIRYVREIIDSNVGTYMNSLNALYTENDNYEVSVIKGDFEVTKRAIVITSATDSKFYDGVEFVNHQISVTGDGYADGESLDCIVSGRITEVGRSYNTLTCTSSNTAELANYAVTKVEGTLTINPVVTFVMNGHGEAISSQNILLGEKVSVPVAPMDASYNFMGWFIDNETFVKPYDFESAVMENRTLYAKWIAKTKILVAKYGEGADDTIHVVVSVINSEAENIADIGNAFVNHVPAIAIPMKPSTLTTDYPFDTWIKSESDIDGLGVYVPVFKPTPRPQQEIIVAVNGMELNVDVPVDGSPEEIITAIENALAEHDPAIILQPTNPHRDSTYTFKDWIKNEDGKYVPEFDSSYKPDVIIQVAVNDSVIISVAIRPYDNGKDISTKIDSELNKQGVAVSVPTSTDSTEFVLDSWIQNEVTGLYEAVFVERSKTFTITYVTPSAMLSDSIMSYTYGSVTKLPKAFIPQDSGWVFRGWYTRVNGLGNRVTSITSTDYGNKKFYAFFQMSISYEAKDICGNVEVAYDADTKKAIETALNSVIPKDFEQGGMTMTFDKWEKTVDGVYVATFKESVSIANTMTTPKFNVSLNDRNLTISDAEIGAKIMIADLKGRVVYNGVIGSSDHMIVLPTAGTYVLRVNNQTSRVVVK